MVLYVQIFGSTLLKEVVEEGSSRVIHEYDIESEYLDYVGVLQPYWQRSSGVSYAYLVLESYYNYDPRVV